MEQFELAGMSGLLGLCWETEVLGRRERTDGTSLRETAERKILIW
jgi:hypothetical protein